MCDEQNLFNSVTEFYDDVSENLDFVCEINNSRLSQNVRDLIRQVHPEILKRNYGSGFNVPDKIEGCKILDFGCGAGVMTYVLSKLVGQNGSLVGIDISPNLITEAKKVITYHQQRWGYSKPNTTFKVANVEMFDDVKEYESKLDLVLSFGVICLCPNKEKVFTNIYKLLKDGGEFSLSDVYADRDRPQDIIHNKRLFFVKNGALPADGAQFYPSVTLQNTNPTSDSRGVTSVDLIFASLGTACSMRWDEMVELTTSIGFTKPYLVNAAPVEFENKELHKATGFAEFVRADSRLFKLPKNVERRPAEVTYNGNIKGCEDSYRWDLNTLFKKGEPVLVDAELATILACTRFKDSFSFRYVHEGEQTLNPFLHIEELRKNGQSVKPAFSV